MKLTHLNQLLNPFFQHRINTRKAYDIQGFNRYCGWITRVINGKLVTVARVTTLCPPNYHK